MLWAACIACHVLGPLILAPVAAGLAAVWAWRYRTLTPILALLAGGLLTAALWAPMLTETAFVHVEKDFSDQSAIPGENPILIDRLLAAPAIYDVLAR